MGIVSFGLLSIVGVYGGMLTNSRDNVDRREAGEAIDALRTVLNEREDFATVFDWTRAGNKELVYVNYRANSTDSTGSPDSNGDSVMGIWIDPSSPPSGYPSSFEAAREGRWIKAKLQVSPNNLPEALSGSAVDYTKSLLIVQVDLEPVPVPDQGVADESTFTTQVGVLR